MTLTSPSSSFYYGFGFNVEPNASWQNVGDFNGTITHEYRGGTTVSSDPAAGFGWSALFNGTPNDPTNSVGYQIGNMMQTAFSNAGGQTGAWVNANLFDQYGVYTGWMTASAYQTYFNAQAAKSLYPSRVEGRNDTGQPMFRAYFAPFHGTAWQSNHGLDCLTYQSTAASMAAEGYQTASLQSYVGANGLRGYQATWVKW